MGELQRVSQVIAEGAIVFVNFVESGFQSLRSCGHDRFHSGGVRWLCEAEGPLQIGSSGLDGVRGQQVLIGQHIVLDHSVARNTERGEKNGAEDAGTVLAGSAVLDNREIACSNSF